MKTGGWEGETPGWESGNGGGFGAARTAPPTLQPAKALWSRCPASADKENTRRTAEKCKTVFPVLHPPCTHKT